MTARGMGSQSLATPEVEETCWTCGSIGDDRDDERQPGWCSTCGFFFDHYGMQVFEPWLACPVHTELGSMCPHPASTLDRHPC
jgi:hypothetical protein